MAGAELPKEIEPSAQGKQRPEIVVSSKALQVAKEWVKNMMGGDDSESEDDDSSTMALEMRPARLGLGAKYVPHSQVNSTMNPVERKLRAITKGGGNQREGVRINSNHGPRASTAPPEESKSEVESEDDEDEVKGGSGARHGRPQRRIGSADLLMKTPGCKGRGGKRKR